MNPSPHQHIKVCLSLILQLVMNINMKETGEVTTLAYSGFLSLFDVPPQLFVQYNMQILAYVHMVLSLEEFQTLLVW